MIKANEIRLGNYLFETLDNKIVKVEQICKLSSTSLNQDMGIRYDKWQSWSDLGNTQPIPLTEELLLKCGFIKYTTKDINPTYANKLFNWNNGILYLIGYGFMNHIKHLHQLQNLYFALCGEELKINL